MTSAPLPHDALNKSAAPVVANLPAGPENRSPLLLSICVPTYHRPQLLARALQSIGPLPPDVEIIVSDNGIGFSPAFSQKIFGLFQRLHQQQLNVGEDTLTSLTVPVKQLKSINHSLERQ